MDTIQTLENWRDNPVRMIREMLGIEVQPWQAQIIGHLWKHGPRGQKSGGAGAGRDIGGRFDSSMATVGSNPTLPAKRGRGRPRKEITKTVTGPKPWLKLGMSERTWWRRRAEERAK